MIVYKMIWIIISIILLSFTYIKLNGLIAPFISSNSVFDHPIKTHQNGIENFKTNAIFYFIFCFVLILDIDILTYIELILLSIFIPLYFYVWSEVKHLSPDDQLYRESVEAFKYYRTFSTFGLINMVNNLLLIIFLVIDYKYNCYFYIFLVCENVISILLGMSDIIDISVQNDSTLSHNKYLKEQHKQIIMEIPKNFFLFLVNNNNKTNAIKNLKVNLHNIRLGIKKVRY